jgi:hypothetical protein
VLALLESSRGASAGHIVCYRHVTTKGLAVVADRARMPAPFAFVARNLENRVDFDQDSPTRNDVNPIGFGPAPRLCHGRAAGESHARRSGARTPATCHQPTDIAV